MKKEAAAEAFVKGLCCEGGDTGLSAPGFTD